MRTPPWAKLLLSAPVSLLLALFMLGTSRWGSYLGVPGVPFYVGDIVLVLAVVQVALALKRRQTSLASLTEAPLVVLLSLALVAYAGIRFVLDMDGSLVALRDAAPYAYGVIALLAFLLPVVREAPWRPVIYAVLTFHTLWAVVLPRLPGFPWSLPVLGSDATLLVTRPDFDTAVMGVAAAYGLHDLLRRGRRPQREDAPLLVFIGLNAIGATMTSTRAGLLSGLLAVGAVVYAWRRSRPISDHDRPGPTSLADRVKGPLAWTAVAVVLLGTFIVLTPTGSRIVDSFTDDSAQSRGTVAVRAEVWDEVVDFVTRSPERTAIGVGFGRNFIEESGARNALEGRHVQERAVPAQLPGRHSRQARRGRLPAHHADHPARLAARRATAA